METWQPIGQDQQGIGSGSKDDLNELEWEYHNKGSLFGLWILICMYLSMDNLNYE